MKQQESPTLPRVYDLTMTDTELAFVAGSVSYTSHCLNGDLLSATDMVSSLYMSPVNQDPTKLATLLEKLCLLVQARNDHEKEKEEKK